MATSRSVRSLLLTAVALFLLQARAYAPLSDDTLRSLPAGGADFDVNTGAILAPILVPRVPGTPGSARVQRHLVDFFRDRLPRWQVTLQNSTSRTPATGDREVPFVNIIAVRDPPWARAGDVGRLTLAAHYDSKINPEGFVGATDSAAPCAMLLHAARSVDEALTAKWEAMEAAGAGGGLEEEKGVQILLLDGEEAFVSWTREDSLYGARSLAEEWEATAHPALSAYHTALSSISLFVLLDLLGATDPNVPSYFRTTHWAYQHLARLETRLRSLSLMQSRPSHPFLTEGNKDMGSFRSSMIEDDHIPFMARGVEILHVIPIPFPRVWHEIEDDAEHLDMPTVEDWARMVTAFVGEWMELEGYFPGPAEGKRQAAGYGKGGERRKTEL